MGLLDGKIAVVTGGGAGIGGGISRRFAAEGATVVVNDIDGDVLGGALRDITDAGGRAVGVAGDIQLGYAGGPTLEAAIGIADVIALTAGINRYEVEGGGHDMVAGVGVRFGSVAIGSLFYLTALALSGGR